MSQPASNLRVRRTQKLLREALVDLIEEKGFEVITVGEITERAMVSRAAFYRNYQDKYDLVEKIFEEAMQPLMEAIGHFGPERPPNQWINFFAHIATNTRLYRVLLDVKGSFWFVKKMRTALASMIKEHAQAGNNLLPTDSAVFTSDFVPTILSGLYIDVIIWWLEQDKLYPPAEIAQRCALLATVILKEAGAWQ